MKNDSIHNGETKEFSENMVKLSSEEKDAITKVELAITKKEKIIAIAKQRAQQLIEEERQKSNEEKNLFVKKSHENSLARAKDIIEEANKESLKINENSTKNLHKINKILLEKFVQDI